MVVRRVKKTENSLKELSLGRVGFRGKIAAGGEF